MARAPAASACEVHATPGHPSLLATRIMVGAAG